LLFVNCHCYSFIAVTNFGFFSDLLREGDFSLTLFDALGFLGLVLIILLAISGLFGGHDGSTDFSANVDAAGGHGSGAGYISIRSISAMLLGFGFGGAYLERNGFSVLVSALGGLAIGFVIGVIYVALMNGLYRLRSDGTAVLADALNRTGTVYIRIPGRISGAGEIQVSFGGTMRNVRAYTNGPELATGTHVRVVALHDDQALIVEKLT